MDIQGLQRINGHSFEDIIEKLTEKDIPHTVFKKPEYGNPFFRDSIIRTRLTDEGRIIDLLGDPVSCTKKGTFYKTTWKVSPEFDYSKFEGPVTFQSGGYLVERIKLLSDLP